MKDIRLRSHWLDSSVDQRFPSTRALTIGKYPLSTTSRFFQAVLSELKSSDESDDHQTPTYNSQGSLRSQILLAVNQPYKSVRVLLSAGPTMKSTAESSTDLRLWSSQTFAFEISSSKVPSTSSSRIFLTPRLR